MDEAIKNSQVQTCPGAADTTTSMGPRQMGSGDYRHRCCHEPHVDRDDLAGKFERCGRLLSHCLGKRRGQGRILRTLCQRGEMPQKELQDFLGIQAGSMSEIAAKLEDKELIVRVRSEEDRRKVSLSITEAGRAQVAQGDEEHILRSRAELFSTLTDEEQSTLESLLDKLSADWAQRLERRGDGEEGHSCNKIPS